MIASLRELFGRLRSLPASGLRRRRADGGFVTLVGAGPGAADLLTLGGLKALQEADVVLYDRLVGADVLALIPDHVQLEDVGKLTGQDHQQTQLRIGERLLTLARAGQRVVRLKGGDPFIFGRGGEELAVLAAHDIPFAVLPGVTAALGCAAYAGIPLTHRDFAQQVTFVTAHCQRSIDRVDWAALGQSNHTVVFYMGVAQLPVIEQRLLAAGRRGETPIALIERGSTAQQRVILGRLSALAALGADQAVIAPSLVIVGEVAALGAELAWFTQPVLAASAAQDAAAA
ncbi:MAG: uroporphyrinogen-III C-methyltransferase [Gammaproteobacteria bacterium]|jgi:uroporphyrin-III C-methyltransferase/precorrin-2 dehydrogenase/sirohydrochlorin ferrochelatase|nr:uroporphyrinogen-III C-methyltransferase [Gammaproteobacteria bacterium]